ncbi:unnamed protein product [Dicrocoelium dendriticum]|nr:unnamed protein product [Dicrocoelium dendriticum]
MKGAREFITPTSFSGLFYSLPQSPQQFKQLLMVGAVDRYMQVARCFRNEPSRSDRQPEFTQLDLEMAFANSDDVMNIIEEMLVAVWPLINVMRSDSTVPDLPLPRMSYQFAMAHYGSDKPDIRFDLRFCEPTRCGYVGFKVHGTDASKFTKSELKKLLDEVNRDTEDGVSFLEVASCPPHLQELLDALKPDSCDIILFVRGSEDKLLTALGNTRTNLARLLYAKGVPIYNPGLHFLWIYDFPLFRRNECGDWECVHHPFTAPTSETLHFVYCDPSRVVAQHYDLVCNGNEVGGGSIRIHDASLQQYILSTILKEDTRQMEYFITALKSGAPPHGGIALDRLIALILNTNSIRDVIAFPKAADGYDLMCGAPSKVPDEDLKHYRITLTK